MSIATWSGKPSLHKNQTMKSRSRTSLSATASFLRVQLRVGRLMQPDTTVLVPQSSVPQLGSTGVAGTLGHGTKIRYISFPDVHNLYGSLPEPKLLDHGTKIRYISVPEVPTRYRTKKYLLGTKFCVADCIKLWRINIRYLLGQKFHEIKENINHHVTTSCTISYQDRIKMGAYPIYSGGGGEGDGP